MCGRTKLYVMTAEDVSQIKNKKLSTRFVDAIKEVEEIAKSYKERALRLKQSISKIIEIGRQDGIPDKLISRYIRDIFQKLELSDSTIQRYLPEELKNSSMKRDQSLKNLRSNSEFDHRKVLEEPFVKMSEQKTPMVDSFALNQNKNVLNLELVHSENELVQEPQKAISIPAQKFDVIESTSNPIPKADQDTERDKRIKELEQLLRQSDQRIAEIEQELKEVDIPANDLMKVLINRAIKLREPYVRRPVKNGIVQLPTAKTT